MIWSNISRSLLAYLNTFVNVQATGRCLFLLNCLTLKRNIGSLMVWDMLFTQAWTQWVSVLTSHHSGFFGLGMRPQLSFLLSSPNKRRSLSIPAPLSSCKWLSCFSGWLLSLIFHLRVVLFKSSVTISLIVVRPLSVICVSLRNVCKYAIILNWFDWATHGNLTEGT